MATELQDQPGPSRLCGLGLYAWAREQAEALRKFQATRPDASIDFAHLIEEVEDLARSEWRAARSQLRRLLGHLLELEYSPAREPRHQWRRSVRDARNELGDTQLTPTMKRALEPGLPELYADARANAAADLGQHGEREAAALLPPIRPCTLDQLIDKAWYPSNRQGLVDEPL
jgi:hypothetical protein